MFSVGFYNIDFTQYINDVLVYEMLILGLFFGEVIWLSKYFIENFIKNPFVFKKSILILYHNLEVILVMSVPVEILNKKSSWQFPTSAFYSEMLRAEKENV